MATPLITGVQLKQICPTLTIERATVLADQFCIVCPNYKIDLDVLEEFIPTVAHESGEFRAKEESLNYKSASRLMAVWPSHFPNTKFAEQYVNNPQKLAKYIYGSTSIAKSLGNASPEDGWLFRGAGFIHITGRGLTTAYAKYIGNNSPVDVANKMRTEDKWALDSACWTFAVSKNLIQVAIDDDFVKITKRINGGTIGMESRLQYYNRAKLTLRKK